MPPIRGSRYTYWAWHQFRRHPLATNRLLYCRSASMGEITALVGSLCCKHTTKDTDRQRQKKKTPRQWSW